MNTVTYHTENGIIRLEGVNALTYFIGAEELAIDYNHYSQSIYIKTSALRTVR